MGCRYDTISFLSDYGLDDEFVGVVKAVVRDLAPHTAVVDLTHGIAPFDVRAGSLALARSISYVPSGVILAVVDPGVGTDRRGVAIEVADGEGVLVGPDNGLLAPAVAMVGGPLRAVSLTNAEYHLKSPGATFDGRDIFAPAAAALCNGIDLAELGDIVDADQLFPGVVPLPQTDSVQAIAEVLWVDRFGNVQLNVCPDDLGPAYSTDVRLCFGLRPGSTDGMARRAVHVAAFGELATGSIGLVIDSSGMFSVVMNRRSAAEELGLDVGDQITITPADDVDPPPSIPVTLKT